MTPLIPDGSLLEIRGPIAALRSGQIVAALIDDELVVHRVHQTGPLIQLMGDNAHRPDPPLPAHAVIGAVHRVTTPRGWQLACTTVGALALGRLLVPAVRIVAALRRTLA